LSIGILCLCYYPIITPRPYTFTRTLKNMVPCL